MPGGFGLGSGVKGLADFGNPAALGRRVRRYGRAIALDLGVCPIDLFEINAGPVMLTSLYGIVVTEAIVGATFDVQLTFTPDDGAATDLSAASGAALNADAIDTIYTWPGTIAGALDVSGAISVGVGHSSFATNFQILVPGIIHLENAGADPTEGIIDWVLHYVPLDTDSVVIPIYTV